MDQIAERLWRWTAPHPDWEPGAEVDSPGDWDRDVGCVFYDTAGSAVFIDPLVPADAESFWRWADQHVAGRPVSVLTTIAWHGRDGDLRFCPESWLEYLPGHITHADLRAMMQPLRSLDVERVLVSHGEPVLSDGARALEALLGGA